MKDVSLQRKKLCGPRTILVGVVTVLLLSTIGVLHNSLLQAILLGPDSLFPPPVAHAMTVQRHGRWVTVPVQQGTVKEHLTFRSAALGGRLDDYDVYLPPGYDDPANATRRYPVVYLLNGAPGQPGDWIHGMHAQLMEDQGIAAGTLPPMIFIMPDGNGGIFRDSQYVNTVSGFRAEDLIAHDVVQYVDSHYRTIADRRARAIAGLSEGGYGAMNLGLKHHDVFGTIVSISGYFTADPAEVFAGNNPWGRDWALMKANSPMLYVPRLAGLHDTNILIMDNTSDRPYTKDAIRFDRELTRWHIPHTLLLDPAPTALGAHYWPYWHVAFPKALAYIGRHIATR